MALFGFCAPILAHTILVMTITRPGHKGTATDARQEVELTRSRKLQEVLGEEAQQRQK